MEKAYFTQQNFSKESDGKQLNSNQKKEITKDNINQIENEIKKCEQKYKETQQKVSSQNQIDDQQNNIIQKKKNEYQNYQKRSSKSQKKPNKNQKQIYQEVKKNKKQNVNTISSTNSYSFLPNNFFVIVEKGFSLFTYKFSEKFMQEHIFCFLNPRDCLKLRLVNKELQKRSNQILFINSQRQDLIIEKNQLKRAYKTQITDLIENEIHEFRQILDSFNDIHKKDYTDYMQMVIPSQNLLIILNIFILIFGQQIVGFTDLISKKDQWKKVINVCFNQGQAKHYFNSFKGKANLKLIQDMVPNEIYKVLREEISNQDSILQQLTLKKNPFLFKVYQFIEKLLDLYEILSLKYPNAFKYINIKSQIQKDPSILILSHIDEKLQFQQNEVK